MELMDYELWSMRVTNEKTTLSRAQTYKLIKEGKFPPPVQLTPCRIAFRSDLVKNWIAGRPFVTGKGGGLNGQ